MEYLAIIGLVLNVLGSLAFIIDSNKLSGLMAGMVAHMADGYGKWDSKKFSKEELGKLQGKISQSKKLTYWGYGLFIAGFVLQLIASVGSTCSQ